MAKQPTNQFRILLDIEALNLDDTEREKLVSGIVKMSPQSPIYKDTRVQAEVANLVTTQAAYVVARQSAQASGKQHASDVTTANTAQIATNKVIVLLKTLTTNLATSEADIVSTGFVAYTGKPPVPALVPPDVVNVTLGKKGSGKATASAQELGRTRRQYAAQASPNPVTASSYENVPGKGKTRKFTGTSGSQLWVQFALVRGQSQSAWSTAVLITFP